MVRFTGRAKEKLTIPTKPIPTGIKAWIIADKGYFLHWFWHAKGSGPQGMGRIPRPLGRNKTAAVVPALLKTLPQGPPGTYGVTLDNLFTSTRLLAYLSQQGYGARGTARINSGIHQDLINLKKSDSNDTIPWGTKHLRLVAEGAVVQLSWKDTGAFCLFMSNMDCGVDTVITKRRRPNETATCAKTARKAFGDLPVKELPRPALTYHYNIDMNGVNRGDQMRASYPIQQRQQKAWKAIFYSLLDIVVVNSFLLSCYAPVTKEDRFLTHRAFREALCKDLFTYAVPTAAAAATVVGPVHIMPAVVGAVYAAPTRVEHQRVKMKRAACVVCKQAVAEERRGIKQQRRLILQAVSPNVTSKRMDRHISRVKTGCASCMVALCARKGCWELFHLGALSGAAA